MTSVVATIASGDCEVVLLGSERHAGHHEHDDPDRGHPGRPPWPREGDDTADQDGVDTRDRREVLDVAARGDTGGEGDRETASAIQGPAPREDEHEWPDQVELLLDSERPGVAHGWIATPSAWTQLEMCSIDDAIPAATCHGKPQRGRG